MSKVPNKDLSEAIYRLIKAGKPESELVKTTAEYLVTERRSRDLDSIMRGVEKLRLQRDDIMEVVAYSAFGLSPAVKQAIKEVFGAKFVKIIERRDESLVGGVRLQGTDTALDLSVRGRLNRLKNVTTEV